MEISKELASTFTRNLLLWYAKHKRIFPWRQTKDAYKIMVSEIMLQQTQAPRVVPKYEAFISRFPTVQSLAAASLSDVIVLWQGLGYNRRAKFLWESAKLIVDKFDGKVPNDSTVMQTLPGFGPYAANAVVAFAYNKPVVVIDANVRRVYNYVFGLKADEISAAVEITVPDQAADFYNALMDLGSLYYKKNSDYSDYPFKDFCKFYNKKEIPALVKYKQSAFVGSNRYFRGQIIKSLAVASLTQEELIKLGEEYVKASEGLLKDGMIVCEDKKYYLAK